MEPIKELLGLKDALAAEGEGGGTVPADTTAPEVTESQPEITEREITKPPNINATAGDPKDNEKEGRRSPSGVEAVRGKIAESFGFIKGPMSIIANPLLDSDGDTNNFETILKAKK